ncbi:helix-turn-helix transcriptional regulator [Enterococcus rivorum]|uniref:HTH cro/C1-type domain-containing protein n=1 Tax=Enterococcus rivorum TaxID=762845 RepID=A0A1E5L1P7_9ENTE|nr:helix-turn-helix transcriptional regulator [Enterococcus rivorum]MBP2098551.1 transcriptional regulator with XRE-family HTH domain [Enterococcus rivorum]OEH83829.1 hypothetical protein BCR26_07465 [Enterococcus rivorum]
MSIGKNIRLKRIELKLTQQQLADQVYVTRQTISKWELGKSQPDLLSQKRLEQILSISFTDIESSILKERGIKQMKKAVHLIGIIGFGFLFLPLRFLWIKAYQNWNRPSVRFFGVPVISMIYLLYLHSLNTNGFIVISALTLLLYLITSFYFYDNTK